MDAGADLVGLLVGLDARGASGRPFVGRVVDRYGPRPSQLFGAVVLGVDFMVLAAVHSLGQYYLVMALLVSLGSTALGPIPSNSAVAGWFLRRRGRALGFATAGISMGGVIFVPLDADAHRSVRLAARVSSGSRRS